MADAPFLVDGSVALGGYIVLETADLEEAVAVARTFPVADSKVEIRPVIQR